MITMDDVLDVLCAAWGEEEKPGEFVGAILNWNSKDLFWRMENAIGYLENLDVENAKERIEWFNISILGPDDLVILANVPFEVIKCDVCGDNYHLADVDDEFQSTHAVSPRGGETYRSYSRKNRIRICNDCLAFNRIVGLFVS